jgi:hypothetical protein
LAPLLLMERRQRVQRAGSGVGVGVLRLELDEDEDEELELELELELLDDDEVQTFRAAEAGCTGLAWGRMP